MSDGAKQAVAWTLAMGISATIYGGGAYWIKHAKPMGLKALAHTSDHDHEVTHKSTETNPENTHEAAADKPVTSATGELAAGETSNHHASQDAQKTHGSSIDHHSSGHHDTPHDLEHKPPVATAKASQNVENHPKQPQEHPTNHSSPHWSYAKNDANGPQHWGDLAHHFSLCEKGRAQSPIDIGRATATKDAPKLIWHYGTASLNVENNGHTIQAEILSGKNHITIDGQPYSLAQFHFHAPSEHRISGVPADMELHFVHKNSSGALAVVGVMIHELAGRENKAFKPIWDLMPRDFHTKSSQPTNLTLASLMPSNRQYFHYSGSLTTPPCSEGVRWFVLANPITLSSGQIEMYTSIFGGPTNRPIQPLQGRDVITNGTPVLAH
jgi:carbonic anhydrase